jgi:hypothetical protein
MPLELLMQQEREGYHPSNRKGPSNSGIADANIHWKMKEKKSWMKSQPFLTNTRDSLPPFKYESLMQYSEENGNRHCKKCKMRQSSGDSGSRQQQRMAMRELLILVQVSL